MHIARQQLLLIALIVLLFGACIVAFVTWLTNNASLNKAFAAVSHTNDVLYAIKEARGATAEADLKGRLELVGMVNGTPKETARADALAKIDVIGQAVSDNQILTANVREIRTTVENRFKIQDEILASAVRRDGTLTTPVEMSVKSIESIYQVDRAFVAINAQKYALLSQRHADVIATENSYNRVFGVLTVFGLTLTILITYFGYRSLSRAGRTQTRIVEIRKQGGLSEKDAQELYSYLEQGVSAWKSISQLW